METDQMLLESAEREELFARVGRGAEYLDVTLSDWWQADREYAIDLDDLDVGNGFACVLAQLHPDLDYVRMRLRLGLTLRSAAGYGLTAPGAGTPDCCCAWYDFRPLTQVWREVITTRRNAG